MSKRHDNFFVGAAKVAGHLVYERVAGTLPKTLADVPRSAASITPEWMTLVMCRDTPGAEVLDVKVSGGSLGSHERRRLTLTYNERGKQAGLTEVVFIKALPTLMTRMLVGFMGHSRYEMLFYTKVRADLKIETPACYFSASDKVSLAALHVIEDVVYTKGATFGDEKTLLT